MIRSRLVVYPLCSDLNSGFLKGNRSLVDFFVHFSVALSSVNFCVLAKKMIHTGLFFGQLHPRCSSWLSVMCFGCDNHRMELQEGVSNNLKDLIFSNWKQSVHACLSWSGRGRGSLTMVEVLWLFTFTAEGERQCCNLPSGYPLAWWCLIIQ